MDEQTKAKLESVRKHTPRYLFRLWSCGGENQPPSGGHERLNTISAITPAAFTEGKGHQSAYHMTAKELHTQVLSHIQNRLDLVTEFSSWSASLNHVLQRLPGIETNGTLYAKRKSIWLYVSVIDVEMLWDTNQIFHVPQLSFLGPGDPSQGWKYGHEYLAHGVIEGPWHRVVSHKELVTTIQDAELSLLYDWRVLVTTLLYNPSFRMHVACTRYGWGVSVAKKEHITEPMVEKARKGGELFGDKFALPMMLSILCYKLREKHVWAQGVGKKELKLIYKGIENLEIPESWERSQTRCGLGPDYDIYKDAMQIDRLMKAVANALDDVEFLEEQPATCAIL